MTRAILTENYLAVPDGQVYPTLFKAGEEVTGNVAAAALADKKAKPAGASWPTPADPAAAAHAAAATSTGSPPPRRARLKRNVENTENGETVKYLKGVIVEGAFAERMVAEGFAVEVADHGGAPETK